MRLLTFLFILLTALPAAADRSTQRCGRPHGDRQHPRPTTFAWHSICRATVPLPKARRKTPWAIFLTHMEWELMIDPKLFKFATLGLHAGQQPDPATGARAQPIYQTTSYVFQDTDQAAALFNLERAGHIYSRISNPTVAVLEERIAALEGGLGAVATASGQAACIGSRYADGAGGTHRVVGLDLRREPQYVLSYLPRFGITSTFVDPRDPDAFARAITPDTRLIFGETLGNPGLEVMDLPRIAEVAHDACIPLMIDNTFATPYLCRPFEHGVDIVMHSATKFLGGHGTSIAGAIVDSGNFDWEASDKFPTLTEPYEGYHGLDFAEEFVRRFIMRARAEGLRDFGATLSPTNVNICRVSKPCMPAWSATLPTPER